MKNYINFETIQKIFFGAVLTVALVVAVLFSEFWIAFAAAVYFILFFRFSRGLRELTNMHAVVLSLIVLHAIPASVMIIQGKIGLSSLEIIRLYSSIAIGLAGYGAGALLFEKLFSSKETKMSGLARKLNEYFWLAYKYRMLLALVSGLLIAFFGFMPLSMSYTESVAYRMDTTGVVQYFTSLLSLVFSVLGVAMISIVGDIEKRGKLSWLSYLLIILVVLSIIAGHRIWIVGLIGCLLIVFQPRLKRRHMLAMAVIGIILFFMFSGAVRYARSGATFRQSVANFQSYMINFKDMNFRDMVWGFSDLTVPFSTFITIVQNVPDKIGYDLAVPVNDLSLLVPTIFYPDRPLSYAQWYVKTFEPEVYAMGGGRTFYIIAIGYLFAGPIGAFFCMLMFGALLECINRFFKSTQGVAGIFLYSYFFTALIGLVRGSGFFGFIKTGIMLYFLIPLVLLFGFVLVFNAIIPKKYLR